MVGRCVLSISSPSSSKIPWEKRIQNHFLAAGLRTMSSLRTPFAVQSSEGNSAEEKVLLPSVLLESTILLALFIYRIWLKTKSVQFKLNISEEWCHHLTILSHTLSLAHQEAHSNLSSLLNVWIWSARLRLLGLCFYILFYIGDSESRVLVITLYNSLILTYLWNRWCVLRCSNENCIIILKLIRCFPCHSYFGKKGSKQKYFLEVSPGFTIYTVYLSFHGRCNL